jgi:hypothetical protein
MEHPTLNIEAIQMFFRPQQFQDRVFEGRLSGHEVSSNYAGQEEA